MLISLFLIFFIKFVRIQLIKNLNFIKISKKNFLEEIINTILKINKITNK